MKIKKGFLILTGLSMLALMIMSVGMLNHPAQAAGEPAAELEAFSSTEETTIPACTPDANGMRAYWPFDDGAAAMTFADVIENTAFNDGACVGDACPTSTTGKVSTAFVFDGVNDNVQVANKTGLDFSIAGDMSIETWVKTSQDCSGRTVFVGRWQASGKATWWLGCDENDHAAFYLRDSDGVEKIVGGTTVINDGEWHHIVGTRDGTGNSNKIYVDGALENTGTTAFTGTLSFTGDKNVTIGYLEPAPFYWYAGTLDEMALYDQALTADDVSRHYLGGDGQSYCNVNPPIANGVTFNTPKDTPLIFTKAELLANDIAPDGGLDLVSITSPSTEGGTITGSDPYTFTPKANFMGTDQFSYKITDQFGKQADGVATVNVGEAPKMELYIPLVLKNSP
jgi:hypothetical protein